MVAAGKAQIDPSRACSHKVVGISEETRAVQLASRKQRQPADQHFKVKIDEKLCKGCYFCVRFCPMGVFVKSDLIGDLGYNLARVEYAEKCTGCKACLLYCPDLAVAVEQETEK